MLRLRLRSWALGSWIIASALAHAEKLVPAGEWILPRDAAYRDTRIGGLSGITYDPKRDVFFLASDTKDRTGSKIFLAKIALNETGIQSVDWTGMLTLKSADKSPLPPLDAEGIALDAKGRLWVSLEGNTQIPSGIACFGTKSGNQILDLPIPPEFTTGIQSNHGFESLSTTGPQKRWLFTTTESPLAQDAKPGLDRYHGWLRLLRYDVKTRPISLPQQRAYAMETDAVYTSVTDVLALDSRRLLVLERQLVTRIIPRSRRIRIYEVDFDQADATDSANLSTLRSRNIIPLKKTLWFDSDHANFSMLDNIEGFCLGPALGKDQTIVLVSDDNFSKTQRTQLLLLRMKASPSH